MTFSVVIPTLNEAAALPATLESVARASPGHPVEVVVVDGGSTDSTRDLAAAFVGVPVRVLTGAAGRGSQLAAGIAASSGEVVLLLHADTWLPQDAFAAIAGRLSSASGPVGGGFRKAFREGPSLLRFGAVTRSELYFRLTGCLFGDQAMFVWRDALGRCGGMPTWALMEDLELSRRLRQVGRLVLLPEVVRTSGRRFGQQGTLRTWWRMVQVQWMYLRGRPVEEMVAVYQRGR
jgi:rSAM/selenodomain-associated transferase 2